MYISEQVKEKMYYPDKKTFMRLAEQGNVIPVFREILADFDTPLSAYLKLRGGRNSYLLESVEGGERLGRYSFISNSPAAVISSRGRQITIDKAGKEHTFTTELDPLEEVKRFMANYKFVELEGLPRFCGGLVGYIGYDMVRFFEELPEENPDPLGMPDMKLFLTGAMVIFDHVDRKIKIVSNAVVKHSPEKAYSSAIKNIDSLASKLKKEFSPPRAGHPDPVEHEMSSNFTQDRFAASCDKAKEYIRKGEAIQMVLSQRLSRSTEADGFAIYRALRSVNPSPYMYYLDLGDSQIIGSSPEVLLRCEDRRVEVRPIAGTRKRGATSEEDRALEEELLADPKERAEHIMLVDLGRNDIGKVCEYGTVRTREFMTIERYSHVMHIVSDVVGRLRDDKDIYDLIRGAFPAGTVSGAPKVRAMELIEELENVRRGVYAGCVGYISFSGNVDMCIAIRTILLKDRLAHVQAGAGIVMDSIGQKEYEETLNKAGAMIKAIELAEKGL